MRRRQDRGALRYPGDLTDAECSHIRLPACVELRYPGDLTDAEWALIATLGLPAKRGGNKRTVDVRAVVNGVMDILSTGCQWAALPKDLPPGSTVNDDFRRGNDNGTLYRVHHALSVPCGEHAGRDASPTAAIIDSPSVKSAEKGGSQLIRWDSTLARRSRARTGTAWSIRKVC